MTRIDELQKKYPGVRKDIILKWEVNANGMKDSKDLDRVSAWTKASNMVYASEDEDLTLQRLKQETPWRFKNDEVLLPRTPLLIGKNGVGAYLHRKNRASLSLRELGEGRLALFEGEELVEAEVLPAPWLWPKLADRPDLKTSKGTPIRDLLALHCPSDFVIQPTQFCEYFNNGTACRFCNYNPSYADARAAGLRNTITNNPDEMAEAVKIYDSEVHWLNMGCIVGGAFKKPGQSAKVDFKFVEKVTKAIPRESYISLATSPMSLAETQRLRDAGLKGLMLQMETFDERLFPVLVPGKAAATSREGWLEAFQVAVEIFGAGNVAAKWVGGVTMQGREGYASWQDARDSQIEGDRWMISHGVYPCMQPLRWAPGSPYSDDPANRTKFPPIEFYLEVLLAHHAAMKEFDFYEKIKTRLLYCRLMGLEASRNLGEIGILEMAGDCGRWNATYLPPEENYIAQILDLYGIAEQARGEVECKL